MLCCTILLFLPPKRCDGDLALLYCAVLCCAVPPKRCDGDLALLYESWWKTRRSVTSLIAPDRRGEPKVALFDRWVGG